MLNILHVGCGEGVMPDVFGGPINETRLDASDEFNPHIVADMTDLGDVGLYDGIYCCHALEHVAIWQVYEVLTGFKRSLNPGGFVIVIVPDLEGILPTGDVVYECDGGPITGLDMYYGHAASTRLSPWMQHKCGFTSETLEGALRSAGFPIVEIKRLPLHHSVMGVGKLEGALK
jgi:hypothetical protein